MIVPVASLLSGPSLSENSAKSLVHQQWRRSGEIPMTHLHRLDGFIQFDTFLDEFPIVVPLGTAPRLYPNILPIDATFPFCSRNRRWGDHSR